MIAFESQTWTFKAVMTFLKNGTCKLQLNIFLHYKTAIRVDLINTKAYRDQASNSNEDSDMTNCSIPPSSAKDSRYRTAADSAAPSSARLSHKAVFISGNHIF